MHWTMHTCYTVCTFHLNIQVVDCVHGCIDCWLFGVYCVKNYLISDKVQFYNVVEKTYKNYCNNTKWICDEHSLYEQINELLFNENEWHMHEGKKSFIILFSICLLLIVLTEAFLAWVYLLDLQIFFNLNLKYHFGIVSQYIVFISILPLFLYNLMHFHFLKKFRTLYSISHIFIFVHYVYVYV